MNKNKLVIDLRRVLSHWDFEFPKITKEQLITMGNETLMFVKSSRFVDRIIKLSKVYLN